MGHLAEAVLSRKSIFRTIMRPSSCPCCVRYLNEIADAVLIVFPTAKLSHRIQLASLSSSMCQYARDKQAQADIAERFVDPVLRQLERQIAHNPHALLSLPALMETTVILANTLQAHFSSHAPRGCVR
jgi:hypothetical protein